MTARPEPATRGWMGRIHQLPADLRERVNRRLRDGATQADIVREMAPVLAERGLPPLSKSGLNRYTTRVERAGRDIREAREAASAWAATAEEGAGDVGRHTIEVLRTIAYQMILRAREEGEDGDGPPLSAAEMKDLSLTLQRLEAAGEHSARREREMRTAMADEVESRARAVGIGDDLVSALREALDTPAG